MQSLSDKLLRPIRLAVLHDVTDAQMSKGAVHDVRAVSGRVHPCVDDRLRPMAMFSPAELNVTPKLRIIANGSP